jgi:hypothetical protein
VPQCLRGSKWFSSATSSTYTRCQLKKLNANFSNEANNAKNLKILITAQLVISTSASEEKSLCAIEKDFSWRLAPLEMTGQGTNWLGSYKYCNCPSILFYARFGFGGLRTEVLPQFVEVR